MIALRYPPGPSSVLAAYRALHRDPLSFLGKMAREYGDIVHLQAGARHDYLINHPDYIKAVLLAGEEEMLRSFSRPMKRVLGQGLLTSQGELHRCQRRLLQPSFHREQLARYGAVMTEYSLRQSAAWRDGKTVDCAVEMLRLSLAIVVKSLFNAEIEDKAEDIGSLLNALMEMTHKNTMPYLDQLLAKLPLPSVLRYRKARIRLDEIMYRMIDERRAARGEQADFLSALLHLQNTDDGSPGMSDRQVRDEAVTMFMAGHETLGSALVWTWYLLAQHPSVEARLHAELDTVLQGRSPTTEDLTRLPYTEMVLYESMRLYPPVWLMVRRPVRDYPIGGYTVPAGSYIHISQYLTHRDSRYFPEPENFDPERWTPEAVATRPKFCYFPFGAGSRKCIGDGFAWMEGLTVVATLAQHWSMRLVPGHPVEPQPLITLRPKYGMLMTLHQRVAGNRHLGNAS